MALWTLGVRSGRLSPNVVALLASVDRYEFHAGLSDSSVILALGRRAQTA